MKSKKPCVECIVKPICKEHCDEFIDFMMRFSKAYLKHGESSYIYKASQGHFKPEELKRIKKAIGYYSWVTVKYSLRPVGRYVLNRVYAITV